MENNTNNSQEHSCKEKINNKEVSEIEFLSIFEQLPLPITVYEPDGFVAAMNNSNKELLHLKFCKSICQFNMYKDKEFNSERFLNSFENAKNGRIAIVSATPIRKNSNDTNEHENKKELWLETRFFPIYNQDKKINYIGEINLDVTEHINNYANDTELIKNNKLFLSLLENTDDCIQFSNEEGIPLLCNKSYLNLFHEFFGCDFQCNVPICQLIKDPNKSFWWKNNISRVLSGNKFTTEYIVNTEDNSLKFYEISFHPVSDNGKIIGYTEFTRDITERKLSEQSIKESEERYKQLTDQIPVGIYRTSSTGQILFANPALSNIFGYDDLSEFVKISVYKTYCKPIERDEQIIELRNDKGVVTKEIQLIRKDGTLTWVRDTGKVLLKSNGEIDYLDGIIEDISERKLAEEQLAHSEEKYRGLIERMNDTVFSVDLKGNFVYLSPVFEKHFKYFIDDLIGYNFSQFIFSEDLTPVHELFNNLNNSSQIEFRIVDKDGSIKYIRINASPVYSESSIIGYSGVLANITEKKLAEIALKNSEQKLRDSNAAKDKFFSIIAHDLKNPFSVLFNYLSLLQEKYDFINEAERKEFINNLFQTTKNTYNLLENLLQWSRAQIGRIDFEPEELDVSEAISNTTRIYKNHALAKEIKLSTKIKPNTLIHADRNMLTTVIRNLVSNAIKFTNIGGEIQISSDIHTVQNSFNKNAKDMLEISVIDNGIGINEEDLSKLFRIDVNFTRKGTTNEQGTGLGLILCKEFVEKHGGTIWAESKPGIGSTFRFMIPK